MHEFVLPLKIAGSRLCRKNKAKITKKMKMKETKCSLDDAPEMVSAKLSQTYSTWLMLKEEDELEYNNKQFVKNMNMMKVQWRNCCFQKL